ncbi:hypothetical protein Syun_015634 [Stephania yunnanensis]|uniref:BZIP domain-containing protein n=1 Tax=Stephania yunnanensis TaxID=152371 RepID=A0AAP0JLW8_9MAGN
MASPGCASSNSSNISEETVLLHSVDERRQRRMLSNRESARRSRLRKQKHLDGLAEQMAQLRMDNREIVERVNLATQHYMDVESENSILRAQMAELNHRLQSLDEITRFLNSNATATATTTTTTTHDVLMMNNSWNSMLLNQQAIVASAEMLEYY